MTEDPSPRDDLAEAFAARHPTRDKSGESWTRSAGAESVEPPEPDERAEQRDDPMREHAAEQRDTPESSAADDLAQAFRGGAA